MCRTIRLALVGDASGLPASLLHSIAAEDVSFEAICGPDPSRVEQAARAYGARWPFDDLDQMLREAEPDAVIVAAPIGERTALAKTCLRNKSAVLLLGAPGTTVTECRALGQVARSANRQLMVGLAHRFSPTGTRARRLLESGRLGAAAAMNLTLAWPRRPDESIPEYAPLPFDLVFDAADRLRSCGLDPQRIWAVGRPYGHVSAIVLARDGVVADLALHHTGTPPSAGNRFEWRSEDGGLLVVENDVNLMCTRGSELVARHQPSLGLGDDPRIECGYAGMVSSFVAALRDRQGVPFGLPSAKGSVTLAAGIFRAARTGRAVGFRADR